MVESSVAAHAAFIFLAILSSVITEVFVKAAAQHQIIFPGLFLTSTQNVSETFAIEISLDGWVGSIWIMLNVWTAGWLVYALSTVIRRNIFGPICCNPEVHPPSNYLVWIFINFMRISWLFLWDRKFISQAFGVKMLISFCSYFMLFVSYHGLHQHSTWLTINCPNERWYIRFMTQNGLALFASWTLIEALINVGVTLRYNVGLEDPLVSIIVLTVLLIWMLICPDFPLCLNGLGHTGCMSSAAAWRYLLLFISASMLKEETAPRQRCFLYNLVFNAAYLETSLISVFSELLVWMPLWFIFESFIFQQYIRYTFTVYPVMVLGLGAMFTNTYHVGGLTPVSIYCGFLMIIATILNSLRLVAVCFYKTKKPAIFKQTPFLRANDDETPYKANKKNNKGWQNGVVNQQFSEK